MDRPTKRVKLSSESQDVVRSLCRIGSISNKGLEELLRRVRAHPEVLELGHRGLTDEMHARFNEVRATLSFDLRGGQRFTWQFADPGLLASKIIMERPHVRAAFLDALHRRPCSRINPWKAIVGFDEFTPGDKLKVNNRRKSMVLSFSFMELGPTILSFDAMWTTPAVVRHSAILEVPGGWSQLLKDFLRYMFFGPHGLQTIGIPIREEQHTHVVFAKLGHLFSDGDGIKTALDWKGASGMKPCWCHWNVLMKGSELVGGDYVDITCHDTTQFKRWTSDELYATIDMLNAAVGRYQAGTMTKAQLDRLEKGCGYNANPLGLLGDVELRTALDVYNVTYYDWMHTALQNGSVTEEIHLFLHACQEVGHNIRELETYLRSDWIFPFSRRSQGSNLWHVFDTFRSRATDKADRLKASASEILGVYSLVRHWVATSVGHRPELAAKRESFDAALAALDLIVQLKRGSTTATNDALTTALSRHLRLHVEAYGTAHIKPKHHWMFDIAEMRRACEATIDAFIIERLHLRVKRQAVDIKELRVYEKAVLAGAINEQFEDATKPFADGLRGKPVRFDGAMVADHMMTGNMRASTDDVVMRGDQAGVVALCVEENGVLMVIVNELAHVAQAMPTCGYSYHMLLLLLLVIPFSLCYRLNTYPVPADVVEVGRVLALVRLQKGVARISFGAGRRTDKLICANIFLIGLRKIMAPSVYFDRSTIKGSGMEDQRRRVHRLAFMSSTTAHDVDAGQ